MSRMFARNAEPPAAHPADSPASRAAVRAAFGWFVLLSLGFAGLHYLIDERPEFVGPPLHYPTTQLLQRSPRMFIRRATDDVSVIEETQPSAADVRFDLQARTDSRGLRQVQDLAGPFEATYTLTNPWDEPAFVLFRFPIRSMRTATRRRS